jgi:hypothetical protein
MQERTKTRTKTFRFDSIQVEKLNRATKRAQVTENKFVADLLAERLIIDPLIPAFYEIRLAGVTFESILNATNADALESAASDMAQKNSQLVRELYESNGIALTFQEFVTDVLGKYGRWFYIEGNVNWSDGGVSLRHQYGLRWSRFLRAYLQSAYGIFSENRLKIEINNQFVRISLMIA